MDDFDNKNLNPDSEENADTDFDNEVSVNVKKDGEENAENKATVDSVHENSEDVIISDDAENAECPEKPAGTPDTPGAASVPNSSDSPFIPDSLYSPDNPVVLDSPDGSDNPPVSYSPYIPDIIHEENTEPVTITQNKESVMPDVSRFKKEEHKCNSGLKGVLILIVAAFLFGGIAGLVMHWINNSSTASDVQEYTAETAEPQVHNSSRDYSAYSTDGHAVLVDVSDVAEEVMPSVVSITNTMLLQTSGFRFGLFNFGGSQTYEVPSSGSGIIVDINDDELLIATNYHVIEDSEALTVTFIDGTDVDADIKGSDEETDIAVIAVQTKNIPKETLSQIHAAVLGDSDNLKIGEGVIAIGNALGLGQSVTVGVISALDREVTVEGNTKNAIQTDAAINPGNSGGALLNMYGEVIGINEAKYGGSDVEGVGYAIPISDVKEIIDELMSHKTKVAVEESRRGYMGVTLSTVDQTASQMFNMPEGAFVNQIMEGSPAATSTLQENDIITKFNGERVKSAEDVTEQVSFCESGESVTLTVETMTEGEYLEKEVTIVLGQRPEDEFN